MDDNTYDTRVVMAPTGTTRIYSHPLVHVFDVDKVVDLGWISFFFKMFTTTANRKLPFRPA